MLLALASCYSQRFVLDYSLVPGCYYFSQLA